MYEGKHTRTERIPVSKEVNVRSRNFCICNQKHIVASSAHFEHWHRAMKHF